MRNIQVFGSDESDYLENKDLLLIIDALLHFPSTDVDTKRRLVKVISVLEQVLGSAATYELTATIMAR